MNILFTIRYFYPFIGGTEKQALTLASRLVRKGLQVKIITSRFDRKWQKREIIDDVEVVRLCSPRIKVIGALIFLCCLAGYLVKNRKEISLIQTFQIGYTSSLSIFLATLLRKPSVIKLASSGRGGDIQRGRKTLWGKLFLYFSKKAARFIVVSTTVKQELMSESVDSVKFYQVGNGVNLNGYTQTEAKSQARMALKIPDKKTIMYTGRLSSEKGVEFLIRSFARVHRRLNCQLLIIADGPEKKNIERVIEQLEVTDAVDIVPAVDDVAPYLRAADLFVLPSQFEGLSNSLLEAMACRLPVISTSVGGSIDIIESGVNGVLIEYNNEERLSQEISNLLGDPELSASLGKHARETVERQHDMDVIAEEYLGVYNSLTRK